MRWCGPRRRIQGSQATRTRVLWTLSWRDSYTILSSGSSQTHNKTIRKRHGARAGSGRQGLLQSRTCAAVVPRRSVTAAAAAPAP